MTLNKNLLHNALRLDFLSFLHKAFRTLNPSSEYIDNWHLNIISQYLTAAKTGLIKRLIINMPPRALKSICTSVAFPAWILGHNPASKIIVASYTNSLSLKHSLDCRNIMESSWYKEIFPNTVLSKNQNQKSKFMTTQNGFRMSTSVGGSVTGEGADILIIDDPHNPVHIYSSKMRSKAIDWYDNTFSSRLNDPNNGVIILVMQRLHEEDLTAHLLNKTNEWRLLKIPAIATHDIDFKTFKFISGSSLYPNFFKFYSTLSQDIGLENFNAQYLQEPIINKSTILSLDKISFYDNLPIYEFLVQSWDTAIKIGENCDFSVGTVWAVSKGKYYLLDFFKKQLAYLELKNTIKNFAALYNSTKILIEDKASGQNLIQDLCAEELFNIIPILPKLDKITRFASVSHLFEIGKVLLPRNKFQEYLTELINFPKVKHDDAIDSTSQFLYYMKSSEYKIARIREF